MQNPPEGRTFIGASVRPSVLPHIHLISDLLGYRSSSDFFRAAVAHLANSQQHLLDNPAATESLEVLATLAQDMPSRVAARHGKIHSQEAS